VHKLESEAWVVASGRVLMVIEKVGLEANSNKSNQYRLSIIMLCALYLLSFSFPFYRATRCFSEYCRIQGESICGEFIYTYVYRF